MKEKLKILPSKNWFKIVFWIILPVVSHFLSAYVSAVAIRLTLLPFFWNNEIGYKNILSSTTVTFAYSLLMFVVMLALMYFVSKKMFRYKFSKEDLGISKALTWSDLGLGILGFVVAMIFSGVLLSVVSAVFPGFDVAQKQDVAFESSAMSRPWQFLLVFFMLAVFVPLIEEFIFRGMIFGQLRKINPALAIILTSAIFGLLHYQWNVGITVFAMSLVMCVIREKLTDSIWAGVVIHFLKNSIAFFYLFIFPMLQFVSL